MISATAHAPTIDIVPAADTYALRCERIRAEIVSLSSLNNGERHSLPIASLFVTSTPPASGRMDISATWTAPQTDPALAGMLFYAGLMALKHQAPGVFADLMNRLRSDGSLIP
jgi:hypothetical protein